MTTGPGWRSAALAALRLAGNAGYRYPASGDPDGPDQTGACGVIFALLSQAGLGPALQSLARRSARPARLRVNLTGRLPESQEVAAYYVVSEALANVMKHSGATAVEVDVTVHDGTLAVRVSDNGAGGVDETRGSGIVGLRDRVEALGGTITVASSPGDGTVIRADLPLGGPEPEAGSPH